MDADRLAALVGPALSEMINIRIWNANQATFVYLDGVLMVVGGLSVVRVHNRRVFSWEVVLTLVGWSGIFIGLARMFAPRRQLELYMDAATLLPGMVVVLAAGAY